MPTMWSMPWFQGGEACEEGRAGGGAGGCSGIGATEAGAFVANAVNVGSVDGFVAIGAGAIAAVLVVHDE